MNRAMSALGVTDLKGYCHYLLLRWDAPRTARFQDSERTFYGHHYQWQMSAVIAEKRIVPPDQSLNRACAAPLPNFER
jgi:hypothetical protein